ncbi:MAG: exosortase-associated EpsI family protein [Lentisphaerae bacterium]|nr:exosortase-associated EpsI family protein [Lentisphaerota bacterium]
MSKKTLPLLLLIFGLIPYALKFPYVLSAWQASPLDRPDVLFFSLALLLAAALLLGSWKKAKPAWYWPALGLALPALLLFCVSFPLDINLLGIVAAVVFAWAMLWLVYGWTGAWRGFPVAAMLLLATTSSRYWLSYALSDYSIDGLLLKLLLAFVLLVLMVFNAFFPFQVRAGSFFFCALLLLALLLYLLANSFMQGPPFMPEFASNMQGEFLGRAMPLTEADLRFFRDSRLEKYHFAGKTAMIDVLVVHCQDDIHQIHPASHCLRSSRWEILNEDITSVIIQNKIVPLTEILAEGGSRRILLWSWYSNPQRSTGGFLGFRRFWRPQQGWRQYQVSTAVAADLAAGRNEMQRFLTDCE